MADGNTIIVLFDIDGTLINAAGAGRLSLDLALKKEFGIERSTDVLLQGRTDLGIFSDYLECHGLESSPELLLRFRQAYLELLPDQMKARGGSICPGIPSMLAKLRVMANCQTGLLTGNSAASAQIKLSHFGLQSFFSFGIFGEHRRHRIELAEDIPPIITKRFGPDWETQQLIVIGDTPEDVRLGKAVGARTIAVATGGHAEPELRDSQPCLFLNDLSDGYEELVRLVTAI